MSCKSLTQLVKNCTARNLVAGAYKLYMIAFNDLQFLSNSTQVYTVDSNNVVNGIGLKSGKNFVEIGALEGSVGLTEVLNVNTTNKYLTQTVTLSLADLNSDNLYFCKTALNQAVVIIVKAFDNSYFIVGLNGLFELSELNAAIDSDNNGYSLSFSGIDRKLSLAVDPDDIVPIPDQPGTDLELMYELTNVNIGESETVFSFS